MILLAQLKKSESKNEKDQNLWSALQHGHHEALSELFKRHHKHLHNYGIKITRNEEIVNEAIQELFLNLWNSRNSLSSAGSVEAYLLSMLRRLIMKQLRRNKNRAKRNGAYVKGDDKELTFAVEDLLIRKEVAQEKREQLEKRIRNAFPPPKICYPNKQLQHLAEGHTQGFVKLRDIAFMKTKDQIVSAILETKIVAIIRLQKPENVLEIAKALQTGGIQAIEVTVGTPNGFDEIEAMATHGSFLPGAGSVR